MPLVACTHPIRLNNPHCVSIQPEEKRRKSRYVDDPQPVGLPLLKGERRGIVESRKVRPILRKVY